SVVHSQHVNLGVKGGLNAYTISGDNSADYEPKIGFNFGLLGHIHFNKVFAVQPEVVYSVQGPKYKSGGSDIHLNLNYVNIPILLQYMHDNGFRWEAGPQLGILVNARSVNGSGSTDIKVNYENIDLGLAVGMSYVKPSTGFGYSFRYNHSFTNINANDAVKSYNRGLQLGLFYLFHHKS
ncbi:MAG: porin family protein, partial [Bacteroidales bacterium]